MQDTRNSHHAYANVLSKQVYLCPKTVILELLGEEV